MKMRYALLTVAALLFASGYQSYAQIDPTVEVSRDYEVKLTEIRKPIAKPSIPDSLMKFDVSFDYSIFDRPYRDLYEFSPYMPANIGRTTSIKYPFISAIVGYNYPSIPTVELHTQFVSKEKFNLGVYGTHNSYKGDAFNPYADYTRRLFSNSVGVNSKLAWNTGEVNLSVDYSMSDARESSKVESLNDTINNNSDVLTLDFNFKSAYKEESSLYYDFDFVYKHAAKHQFSNLGESFAGLACVDSTFKEDAFSVDGKIGTTFDVHRIYLNIHTKNSWYGGNNDYYLGVVEFAPMYEYQKGRVDARMGVKFGNRYGLEESTNIFPEVDAKVEIVKNALWAHLIVTGGNDIIAMSDVLPVVPWFCPGPVKTGASGESNDSFGSSLKFGSRPVDAKLSVETLFFGRFSLNPYVSIVVYKNKMRLFPLLIDGRFPLLLPVYTDYHKISEGVDAYWESKDFMVSGMFRHNSYSSPNDESLYLLPAVEAIASFSYNYRKRIYVRLYADYIGKREYQTGDIPPFFNLGARLDFVLNKHFSFYLKGDNLLNKDNYRYPYISGVPVNYGGGICLNF